MENRERMIQLAIVDLDSGNIKSLRAADSTYEVPRSTLRDRRAGKTTRRVSHEQQQRLTSLQEEFLVEWIIEQDS